MPSRCLSLVLSLPTTCLPMAMQSPAHFIGGTLMLTGSDGRGFCWLDRPRAQHRNRVLWGTGGERTGADGTRTETTCFTWSYRVLPLPPAAAGGRTGWDGMGWDGGTGDTAARLGKFGCNPIHTLPYLHTCIPYLPTYSTVHPCFHAPDGRRKKDWISQRARPHAFLLADAACFTYVS